MNDQLQKFARQTLKDGLAQLPKKNQLLFKRMYSHDDLEAPINDVVDKIGADNLDWAMQQVQRTIDGQKKKEQEEDSGQDNPRTGQ